MVYFSGKHVPSWLRVRLVSNITSYCQPHFKPHQLLKHVIIPVPCWRRLTSNFFFSSVLNCWKRWLGLTDTSNSSVMSVSPPPTSASQWLALTAWQEDITRVTLLSADPSATEGERQIHWSIRAHTSESRSGGISLQHNQIHQSLKPSNLSHRSWTTSLASS